MNVPDVVFSSKTSKLYYTKCMQLDASLSIYAELIEMERECEKLDQTLTF